MYKNNPQIFVYITADKERVLGGDPLTLYLPEENERKEIIVQISRALRADVVQLKNGDYLIIGNSDE